MKNSKKGKQSLQSNELSDEEFEKIQLKLGLRK